MSPRVKLMSAGMALFVLTMAGLLTLYQVLFDVWMTAYPFANTNEWRTRLYVRVVTFILIGVFWSALVTWMVRQRRRG
jgi:hypothetical protein